MNTRTLLVDSNALLKRSFFGAKDAYTDKFGHIGGLYGFFTTMRKQIKEHMINKIVLVWDGQNGGIHRYRLDPNYKANRKDKDWSHKIELTDAEIKKEKEKDESKLKNKNRIQQYAEVFFLRQIEVDEIEADDIIAAYCIKNHTQDEIFLLTNDRDFIQLLDLNITIIFANIQIPVTKANFFYDFNYHYSNGLIIKIITGDVSDNIIGVKGIKEDSLIKYFPDIKFRKLTVREICQRADVINKERIANKQKPLKIFENLLSSLDRLMLNYRLTNLYKPFLSDKAIDEIEQLEMPLSPEGRGSKNLYNMMIADDFMSVYGGKFGDYIQPFFTVIMYEQKLYDDYQRRQKNT